MKSSTRLNTEMRTRQLISGGSITGMEQFRNARTDYHHQQANQIVWKYIGHETIISCLSQGDGLF